MAEELFRTSISKLTGPNFLSWRNAIITQLGFKDLDNLIQNSPPVNPTAQERLRLKQATTFIQMHLDHQNDTMFVDDPYEYLPKNLWDAICSHYAKKSMENISNTIGKMHNIDFSSGNLTAAIIEFRELFRLLREVSAGKFDSHTLEAMWSYHILERIPKSFHIFKSLRYSRFKDTEVIELQSLFTDLETELRRQDKLTSSNTALLVKAPIGSGSGPNHKGTRKPQQRAFCSNGKHNPLTTHSEAECHQLHPERAIAYYQSIMEKQNNRKEESHCGHCLSSGLLSNSVILDSRASGHYLKDKGLFNTYLECSNLLYAANGSVIPIVGCGQATIKLKNGNLNVEKAFHAPSLTHLLVPLSTYLKLGYSLAPTPYGFKCSKGEDIIFTGQVVENLLILDSIIDQAFTSLSNSAGLH